MKSTLQKILSILIFITILLTVKCYAITNNTVSNTNSTTTANSTADSTKTTSSTTSTNKTTKSTTTSTKSSNANLKTLGVTPKEYDFKGFNKNKTSYSTTVPNSVNSLKVAYKTEDANAKVTIKGSNNLEAGTNNIKVVVTAQDGTKKTYTIKVTKLATEDSKPGNLIEDSNVDLYLTSLSIKGLELSPEFDKNTFAYETTIDMDKEDLSKVTVKAEANKKNADIEITGNTDLVEGENLINIIVKSSNSSEQTVYQITVNKVSKSSEIVSGNVINKVKNIKREHLIIGTFVFIVALIFAIIITKKIKNKNDHYDEDDEEIDYDYNDNNLYKDNFIEDLYNRRNNGESLNRYEEETIEDIEKENDRIFNKPKKGENVEYNVFEDENENLFKDDYIEERMKKRKKGKHF